MLSLTTPRLLGALVASLLLSLPSASAADAASQATLVIDAGKPGAVINPNIYGGTKNPNPDPRAVRPCLLSLRNFHAENAEDAEKTNLI